MSGVAINGDRDALVTLLEGGGFLAASEEADQLLAAAADDEARLTALVGRRLGGEPLAWITGRARFCGLDVRVDPGVYVPRWQSEVLARRAAERMPADGVAIDLCTGSGAIAMALAARHPNARVVATDTDELAVRCARANGVEALQGDLFGPVPVALAGTVDVVVGVVPYVPTPELGLLQRDTLVFESALSYDGGPDGTAVLRRVMERAPEFLRPGGALLLELGGEQADALGTEPGWAEWEGVAVLHDDEGDVRGIEARATSRRRT